MGSRTDKDQTCHDEAIYDAKTLYTNHGIRVWINPNGERNKPWGGEYIDIIVPTASDKHRAWVVEVETKDSITDQEAKGQWKRYDDAYNIWHLAVPRGAEDKARELLNKHHISDYTMLQWMKNEDGTYTFWGLPRLD